MDCQPVWNRRGTRTSCAARARRSGAITRIEHVDGVHRLAHLIDDPDEDVPIVKHPDPVNDGMLTGRRTVLMNAPVESNTSNRARRGRLMVATLPAIVLPMRDAVGLPDFEASELDAIVRDLGLTRLILFGSRATGSPPPGPDSDLDLAYSARRGAPGASFWDVSRALGRLLPRENLDVVSLAGADPLFRWEILRDGIPLLGNDLDFADFRAFAYRDFIDSRDLRELEGILFRKKMAYIRGHLRAPA